MEASNITQTLGKYLSYYADKSKVIASNVANLDTPGYKTKDLSKFEDLMQSKQETKTVSNLQVATTNKAHMQSKVNTSLPSQAYSKVAVANLQEDSTGNNVDIDKQMALHAQNNIIFNATKAAFKKDSMLMKSVIDSSTKLN